MIYEDLGLDLAEQEIAKLKEEKLNLQEKVAKLRKALEFYAQKPVPDITSEFAKSAEEWGESCATWEPLTDLGERARKALEE